MPQLGLAAIAALIGAGSAAAGTGLAIDQSLNQPSVPQSSALSSPTQTGPNPQTANAIKAAVGQAAPDIVSQTGGSVSPGYTLTLAQLLGGTGNTPGGSGSAQDAINQIFGLQGGNSSSSFTPAGIGGTNGAGSLVNDQLSSLNLGG